MPGDAAALVADADAHVVDVGRSEVGVRHIRDGKEGSGGRVEETHDATCVALNEEIIALKETRDGASHQSEGRRSCCR